MSCCGGALISVRTLQPTPFFLLMIRQPPRPTLFPLHDALPISTIAASDVGNFSANKLYVHVKTPADPNGAIRGRSEEHTSELQSRRDLVCRLLLEKKKRTRRTGLLLQNQRARWPNLRLQEDLQH